MVAVDDGETFTCGGPVSRLARTGHVAALGTSPTGPTILSARIAVEGKPTALVAGTRAT